MLEKRIVQFIQLLLYQIVLNFQTSIIKVKKQVTKSLGIIFIIINDLFVLPTFLLF
jgi:hypothetical protein